MNNTFEFIKDSLEGEINALYKTTCSQCGLDAQIISTVRSMDIPIEIKYKCRCSKKTLLKIPDDWDKSRIETINKLKIDYWYPEDKVFKGWQIKKLEKKGIDKFVEIYTHRNLYAISAIFDKIKDIKDDKIRKVFVVIFTSMIAQASKMIANYKNNSGGPSWKINTFWLPENWQELNPWVYFENRYKKMIKGKIETNKLLKNRNDYQLFMGSSTDLSGKIADNSVDYIFTDPPYGGEGIQYLELSFLWNSWLSYFGKKIDWDNEVIYNPYRNKKFDNKHYEKQLTDAFKEAYRLLKDDAWMTVTFANKDLSIWNALIRAFKASGFKLVNIVPMSASAPNITQMLLKDSPKTDLIINLKKTKDNIIGMDVYSEINISNEIERAAISKIEKNGRIKLSEIFDQILIKWLTVVYSQENDDVPPIIFDKERIERFMDNNPNFTKYYNQNDNDMRSNADIEWKYSENLYNY